MITKFNEFEQINEGMFTSPAKLFVRYTNAYMFTPETTTPYLELYPKFKSTENYNDITAKKLDRNTVSLTSGEKGQWRPEIYQDYGEKDTMLTQSVKLRMKKLTNDFQIAYPEYTAKFNMMGDHIVTITKKED